MMKMLPVFALVALTVIPSAAFSAATDATKDFVTDAIKGDNSEIALGQLVEQRGGTADIRDFGKMLVTDHTKAKDEMAKFAGTMGVNPPADPKPEAKQEYDRLAKMSAADFDREFINGTVKEHEKDIAEFEKQAKAGNAASKVAENQLPTLRKHLATAKSIQSKL